MSVLKPASATGVPDVSSKTITPPKACVKAIAPSLLTVAETLGTIAADTAATKSAAVPVPPIVAVTGVVNVLLLAPLALIVNVSLTVNVGVVVSPVIVVGPLTKRS